MNALLTITAGLLYIAGALLLMASELHPMRDEASEPYQLQRRP